MKYFFIHIPKTAGTSLRALLQHNVSADLILSVYPGERDNWASVDEVRKNPEKYKDKQYFMGHFKYGLHNALSLKPGQYRYIAFLRNPVDRVVSLYKHFLVHPAPQHDLIVSEQLSLLGFLQHPKTNAQAINDMTKMISGAGCDLKRAIQHIDNDFLYIGCMEKYDQSLGELCDILDWNKRPQIYENATLVEEPLLDAEGMIENLITSLNQDDIKLYQYCCLKQNTGQQPKINKQFDNAIIWRSLALHVENSDINLAYSLMKQAHKLKPEGQFIKKKLAEYEVLLSKL